jgi:ABC-2 type transport system ATP-binding protein
MPPDEAIMTSAAIRVRGLRKRYRDVLAVDELDLEIPHGEVFALLGPNGAGKSTTVEILEGYRGRDAGEVSVLGADPAAALSRPAAVAGRSWRARVGIVPQLSRDTPEVTVSEIVRHFAGFYPRPRDPDEVIAKTGLTEKAGTRLRALSGGQRRRVDVALGIVGRPELMFLDEPTTGFDPEARRQFWGLVRDLSGDGTTILLTTHYLDEAEALADRVGVIARGRLRAVAPPATLGGRDRALAQVAWSGPDGPRSVRTDMPAKTVAELAAGFGGEPPGLTVTRPSLEDAYLTLIGETP